MSHSIQEVTKGRGELKMDHSIQEVTKGRGELKMDHSIQEATKGELKMNHCINCLETAISIFLGDDETAMKFPNALTPPELDYIIGRVSKLNGITWEIKRRREMDFIITLHKQAPRIHFSLSNTSRQSLVSLMRTARENGSGSGSGMSSRPQADRKYAARHDKYFQHHSNFDDDIETVSNIGSGNRIHINYPPLVPPQRASDDFAQHRQSLPIWKYKDEILQSLWNHQVTIIMGKSGSGKSTQVPQFIMDSAANDNRPTKILSCHPHRVSIIAASSCVARERGERVGISVGYQARLESCFSPCASILLFSTSELFLRSLIPPNYPVLQNLNYFILDDVHVRSADSDFALACLLSLMPAYRFHLILLCGEMDSDSLMTYLRQVGIENPNLIHIQGDTNTGRVFHLAEIEEMLNKYPRSTEASLVNAFKGLGRSAHAENMEYRSPLDTDFRCKCCNLPRSGHVTNDLIQRYLYNDDKDAAEEFTDLVLRYEVDIHGKHKTGLDFCVAAAIMGDIPLLSRFSGLGADLCRSLKNKQNIVSLLRQFRQPEAENFFNYVVSSIPCQVSSIPNMSPNLQLVQELIEYIHSNCPLNETILVFLSSYDEIIALKEMLFNGRVLNPHSFVICLLHVNIPCGDEKIIFETAQHFVRKIILTTDVADTVSIKDAGHVIDTGYTEEKCYNAKNNATGNRKVLISKASAVERIRQNTYRLYDFETFQKMSPFRTAVIVQSPLQELCLYSSSLLKNNRAAMEFFGQFLSPPSLYSLNRSFQELIEIGALDKTRKMTALGCYLLDFPVEPRLGKALIFASILRCLDPVLTIVAVLSHRDPFKTPVDIHDKVKLRERKEELSKQTYSDHMTMLQAFLDWENACASGGGHSSLSMNYVSSGIFDMICAIRTDLLGQLRAFGFVRCKGVGNIKDLNINSHNWSVVKAALIAALYPNVMRVNQRTWALSNNEFQNARFHPSSCIARDPMQDAQLPSIWTLYEEVNEQGEMNFCKGCTFVSTFSLLVFGGSPYRDPEVEDVVQGYGAKADPISRIKLNDWIVLEGPKLDIELVLKIRKKFESFLEKQLRKPGSLMTTLDEKDLQTVTLILTTEDRAAGLSQIDGIGQWPRYAGGSLLSVPCQGFTTSVSGSTTNPDEEE